MFYPLTYLFFKMKLIQPSKDAIMYWMHTKAINKLEYALTHGNYKTRQFAAEALEQVGNSSSIPVLLNAINDKIHKVSIAALNALETLGHNEELIIAITKRRFKWFKDIGIKDAKQHTKKEQKYNIYRWERTSKKNFEMVKERLKRPIR